MYIYNKPIGKNNNVIAVLAGDENLGEIVWQLKMAGYNPHKCNLQTETDWTDTPFMGDREYTKVSIVFEE